MPDGQQTVSVAGRQEHGPVARVAIAKVLILLGLFVWAFWPEFRSVARTAIGNSDWAHGLVVPVAILILALRRRSALAAVLTRGSVWGVSCCSCSDSVSTPFSSGLAATATRAKR
ncbi:MAG TPA: hypothetical protein VM487_07695 [Phycisphaerae bacterium]|nr:hypothetical protein [Phycisphaerae bacterium]